MIIFAIDMKQTELKKSVNEAQFNELLENLFCVGKTLNVFAFARMLMESRNDGEINSDQFTTLLSYFTIYCKANNISTTIGGN